MRLKTRYVLLAFALALLIAAGAFGYCWLLWAWGGRFQ